MNSLKETARAKPESEAPPPPAPPPKRIIREDVSFKDGDNPNLLGEPEPEPEPKVPDTGEKEDTAPKKRSTADGMKKPGSVSKPSGVRHGLKGRLFFTKIREGKATIDDAWPYWREVVEDAHQHLAFKGNLQTLLQEHPGLAYFYRSILTDAQQTRRWMEMKAEQAEVEKYKWLMTSEEAKKEYGTLKTTEAAKFAKADEEVLNLNQSVRVLADIEHHLDNVALGFQDRGIMLSHIRAVREAGHEEVWVDSNLETDTR